MSLYTVSHGKFIIHQNLVLIKGLFIKIAELAPLKYPEKCQKYF